jgi:hypothetical protein
VGKRTSGNRIPRKRRESRVLGVPFVPVTA